MRTPPLAMFVAVWTAYSFVSTVHAHYLPIPNYDLHIPEEDKYHLFQYIDRDGDGVLMESDIHRLFDIHSEAAPDKTKFLDLTGSSQRRDFEVFKTFLDDRAVEFAMFECSFVKSLTLRKECYEDKLITYVHLVLHSSIIKIFYSLFRPTSAITYRYVRLLLTEGDDTQQEEEAHNFLRELGGEGEIVTEKDFDVYVRQTDLHDAFRACFAAGKSCDYECLRDSVIDYTRKAMTEMDIAVIFQAIDADGDGMVEPSDVADWCSGSCDPAAFLKMMSSDGDTVVEYGEFRTFIKKQTVKIRIERACQGPFPSQVAELNCYSQHLFAVVSEHHKPIWLNLLVADMVFLFEDLDVDDNGQIHPVEDLMMRGYPRDIAEKFRDEMDGDDEDSAVSLKEFNEYVYEPSVVYALAGCKAVVRGPVRTKCYINALQTYITQILTPPVIEAFFKEFDVNGDDLITYEEVESLLVKPGKVEIFFDELGMGDKIVNKEEFRWYVRQPRISQMILDRSCAQDKTNCLKEVLLTYIETTMTEMDKQILFGKLDTDGQWEIEASELQKSAYGATRSYEEADLLIRTIDNDNNGGVNFEEFRLFLLLRGGRDFLEAECSHKKLQSADMDCYEEHIWFL